MKKYLAILRNKKQLFDNFDKLENYYGVDPYVVEKNDWSRFNNIYGEKSSQIILQSGLPVNGNIMLKSYIATQQPISSSESTTSTIEDFWQMIWDYDVKYIVNLNDKNHNANYFLSNQLEVNNLIVTMILINPESKLGISFRFVTIKNKSDNQMKTAIHIFYPKWKDYGVPSDAKEFMELIKYVVNARKHDEKMLIHCRAGVGRTGTFILIDYIMNSIPKGIYPDIIDTIKEMRTQRCAMIQNKQQLEFGITIIEELLKENLDH